MNPLWFLLLHIYCFQRLLSPPVLLTFQRSAVFMECETAGLKRDLAASSI